ncbi:MAG: hypothetical protein J6C52_11320 [Clostridia bacterium]|nr:hypothetical protein [Clostridia bacterium]
MQYEQFPDERYDALRRTYRDWWADRLPRPIVPIVTYGHPSHRQPSPHPALAVSTAWDLSISPEQFVDAHDWQLSTRRFHGDAFPYFPLTSFGPGVLAAFLGCRPIGAPRTVWFEAPRKDIPIEELHFTFDETNPCFGRVLATLEAAMERWHGQVVIGMADLGGVMDVLASFRGTENLLMDLLDDPDEVLRCVGEIQTAWFAAYDRLNAAMAPEARGYSQWFRLYGEEPGYILQSDFSYMISPGMFGQFVAPELAASAARMTNAVYHMDGIGEIPHLEQLLAIDGIKGIQWVPGDGEPSMRNWDALLEKILASGKKLLSWNQKPDGSAIDGARPGQLYFGERSFAADDPAARSYAARWGIALTEE